MRCAVRIVSPPIHPVCQRAVTPDPHFHFYHLLWAWLAPGLPALPQHLKTDCEAPQSTSSGFSDCPEAQGSCHPPCRKHLQGNRRGTISRMPHISNITAKYMHQAGLRAPRGQCCVSGVTSSDAESIFALGICPAGLSWTGAERAGPGPRVTNLSEAATDSCRRGLTPGCQRSRDIARLSAQLAGPSSLQNAVPGLLRSPLGGSWAA